MEYFSNPPPKPLKCPPQDPSQGPLEEDASGEDPQKLEQIQPPPAQPQAVPGHGGGGQNQESRVCRNRGRGAHPPEGPEELIDQPQPRPQGQGPGQPQGLLPHRRGHQPKSREKKPPSRRGSS